MRDTLSDPAVAGLAEGRRGFILWRNLGGEAEILTLCVAPESRRQGIAGRLLAECLRRIGPLPVHLELRAGNAAAEALYRSAGFRESGRRPGYYPGPTGRADAVLMTRTP